MYDGVWMVLERVATAKEIEKPSDLVDRKDGDSGRPMAMQFRSIRSGRLRLTRTCSQTGGQNNLKDSKKHRFVSKSE